MSYLFSDHLGSTSLITDSTGALISETKYKAWGEVRYSSGSNPTNYTYTGQYSYTNDFGLMFYNARWYDPSLGRFAQADTIVPSGVQGLDRYAYVNNSPLMYVDPSGHYPTWCGPDNIYCGGLPENNYYHRPAPPASNGSYNLPATNNNNSPLQGGYMGGASPAGVYQWQHFSSGSPSEASDAGIEAFADILNLFEMASPNSPPTLNAFLSYSTSDGGDVINIRITIINAGVSSATLNRIEMSEEALPSMYSCAITTNCTFQPLYPVHIDPREVEIITICQNCLENRSTIYSHPFNPNKNNYIEVFMVLSMPIDHGFEGITQTNMPFIYTISPR